jgi:hypothetical protein
MAGKWGDDSVGRLELKKGEGLVQTKALLKVWVLVELLVGGFGVKKAYWMVGMMAAKLARCLVR